MNQGSLRDKLMALRAEIDGSSTIGGEDRARLQRLAAEIEALVEGADGEAVGQDASLANRVSEAVERFEVSHPRLTAAISQMSNALSQAGL